jgi:hypothetical protein
MASAVRSSSSGSRAHLARARTDRAGRGGWRACDPGFPAGPGEVRNASYGHVHADQPQTLSHALADSPVGLLAWNSQCMGDLYPDALLTHVMSTG